MKNKRDKQGQFAQGSQGHLGYKHSDASKKLISQSRKGKNLGEANPNYNPHRHSDEQIECACGCGTSIPKYDKKGRPNKYIVGHQATGKPRLDVSEKLRELWATGKLKARSGEKHWNWKGGRTPLIHLLRNTPEYNTWRHTVYARDYWTCQECGKHCGRRDIVAHHIKSFKDYPELRFEVENGITYCRKCHMQKHRATFGAS